MPAPLLYLPNFLLPFSRSFTDRRGYLLCRPAREEQLRRSGKTSSHHDLGQRALFSIQPEWSATQKGFAYVSHRSTCRYIAPRGAHGIHSPARRRRQRQLNREPDRIRHVCTGVSSMWTRTAYGPESTNGWARPSIQKCVPFFPALRGGTARSYPPRALPPKRARSREPRLTPARPLFRGYL